MSKQAWVWTLLLAGIGATVYAYRETIREELGFEKLSTARVRAIGLAKDAYNLDSYQTNVVVIENRLAASIDGAEGGVWDAWQTEHEVYLVRCAYREHGARLGYLFLVDLHTLEVVQLKQVDSYRHFAPGTPR